MANTQRTEVAQTTDLVPSGAPRINPLTRIIIMLLVTTPLLFSLDWVSASVSLAITIVVAFVGGVGLKTLAATLWPLLLIAPLSGISMLLYGAEGGEVYFEFWLMTISDNSVELAIAIMIRILAVASPVILLARNIDPTRLGDSLAQILHFPDRFVIGSVAGVRMTGLFKDDWVAMNRARRARGLGDRGKIAHFFTMAFGLLVLALRRGGKLATAMEARGFGRDPLYGDRRTWARPSHLQVVDWKALGLAVVCAAIPIVVSVLVGSWRWFGL